MSNTKPARRLSLITFDGLSKTSLDQRAAEMVAEARDLGNAEIIAERLATVEYVAKKVRENPAFLEAITDQLRASSGKLTLPSGTTIEATEAGVSYDYSHNPEWVELAAAEKEVADKRKALEERLKKIPAGKVLVDTDTGEVLVGPSKTSKSTYKITLQKS